MLISNLTALVLDLFIHLNANLSLSLFFSLPISLSLLLLQSLFFFLETLDCWWKNANERAYGKFGSLIWGCESVPTEYSDNIETGVFGYIHTTSLSTFFFFFFFSFLFVCLKMFPAFIFQPNHQLPSLFTAWYYFKVQVTRPDQHAISNISIHAKLVLQNVR